MANITITTATDVGQGWVLTDSAGSLIASSDRAEPTCVVRDIPDADYTTTWSGVDGYELPVPADRIETKTITTSGSFASPTYAATANKVTGIWANDGSDKVIQDELRNAAGDVTNHAWDGTTIKIKAARNEMAAFSLYLEAAISDVSNVAVSFSQLDEQGVGTDEITSAARAKAQLYEWAGSNIELFFVRYLEIKGLSYVAYGDSYDERHVPHRMRRPFELVNNPPRGEPLSGSEGWVDRPGGNRNNMSNE